MRDKKFNALTGQWENIPPRESINTNPHQKIEPHIEDYNYSFFSIANPTVYVPIEVLKPADNAYGALIISASARNASAVRPPICLLIASPVPPQQWGVGEVISRHTAGYGGYFTDCAIPQPIFIEANKGVYFITDLTGVAGYSYIALLANIYKIPRQI